MWQRPAPGLSPQGRALCYGRRGGVPKRRGGREHPAGHGARALPGLAGLLYARKRRTSPPVVFRAATADELAAKITEYEAGR